MSTFIVLPTLNYITVRHITMKFNSPNHCNFSVKTGELDYVPKGYTLLVPLLES